MKQLLIFFLMFALLLGITYRVESINSEELLLYIDIYPYAEIEVIDNIFMDVDFAAGFTVERKAQIDYRANCNVQIMVESQGFDNALDQMVTYRLSRDGQDWENPDASLKPGQSLPGALHFYYEDGPKGEFLLAAFLIADDVGGESPWFLVEADEYQDTITLTISSLE